MFSQGFESTLETGTLVDKNQDEFNSLYQQLAARPYFAGDEQGVFHPMYHQVLKMRGNKMADLFVDHNTGLRLDPATQSVNIFANHLKHHVAAISSWVTGDQAEYIKGSRTLKVGKHDTIEINGNATLVVNGNVDAKIKENATIAVGKNVSVKGKNVDIVAEQTLHLDGKTILLGLDKIDDHNAARYHDYYELDEQGRKIKRRGVEQSGKVWMG